MQSKDAIFNHVVHYLAKQETLKLHLSLKHYVCNVNKHTANHCTIYVIIR